MTMFGPSGFFCFTHLLKTQSGESQRYAFAYKPPGPLQRGALDELMLAMCKGPLLPDAVVVVGLKNELGTDLLEEMQAGSSKVAQQRLQSRIPLVFASYDLTTDKAKITLLDNSFRKRNPEFASVVSAGIKEWFESGLRTVFDPKEVLLQAPSGYTYQKPSGARSELFLKPDLALKSSATVAFVALALFQKLFAGKPERYAELQTVFVDTMAIAPVAYGLRDLLSLCGFDQAFHIESFHSYGGLEEVKRPLPRTSLCMISSSSSMSLHEQWLALKEVAQDEVVTLLTLKTATKFKDGALLAIEKPGGATAAGPAQLSIRIKGETFMPEQEPAKKVLLSDLHHRSDEEVSLFCDLAGKRVFDVFRRPAKSSSKVRPLYVDGMLLIEHPEFDKWLVEQLLQSVKAATKVIVHQDDPASFALGERVKAFCIDSLDLKEPTLLSARKLPKAKLANTAGIIVCATVVGKGSQLLEVSRSLRDMHDGPRLYIIGYQVAETRSELKALKDNLKHSKSVPYQVERFGAAAVGTQLLASFEQESKLYYGTSKDLRRLPGLMANRSRVLSSTKTVGDLALLPHGASLDGKMRLRAGFAYWPKGFEPQACHAEVLATVAVLLQRAREHDKLPDERRLSTASYRHVVLDPENFTRFNDGVLQAALLRNAYPSELDYRGDRAASDFMKALIIRTLARATQEAGEATLEFILALSTKRLQLEEAHHSEIVLAAKAGTGRPASIQHAIDFLLSPPNKGQRTKQKLPF
jgi:hypothetical protein